MPPLQEQSPPVSPSVPPVVSRSRPFFFWIVTGIIVFILCGVSATAWMFRDQISLLLPKQNLSLDTSTATTTSPCYISQSKNVFWTPEGNTVSPVNSYAVLGADPTTFTPLTQESLSASGIRGVQSQGSICYGKDASHVFFNQYVITGADINTFQILTTNPRFAKDKNGVYRDGMRLFVDSIDVSTFSVLNGVFAKDAHAIYWSGQKSTCCEGFFPISDIDVKSFEPVGYYYGKDANAVYYQDEKLNGADPNTFVSVGDMYAKDKNNVYFYDSKIQAADPSTFMEITGSDYQYSKDAKAVYFQTDPVVGANPVSFIVLDDDYARDANHVYIGRASVLDGVDLNTFTLLGNGYAKDAHTVWWKGYAVQGVDLATFKNIYPDSFYPIAKDIHQVYIEYFSPLEKGSIDTDTFQVLSSSYAKDKNSVYYFYGPELKPLVGADPSTFSVVGNPFGDRDSGDVGKDKNHVYKYSQIVSNIDPTQTTVINDEYSKDTAHVYFATTTISNDPENFWLNPYNGNYSFAIDSTNVYYQGKPIEGADVKTFVVQRTYPYFYGVDSKHVYYLGYKGAVLIPEADPASFVVIDDSNNQIKYEAQDKNHFFYDEKVVK